jgi:hypothetical protein
MPGTQEIVNRGAEFIAEGASKFSTWRDAMQQEFPDLASSQAAKIWGQPKRRATHGMPAKATWPHIKDLGGNSGLIA